MIVKDVHHSTQKTHLDVIVVVTGAALLQGSWLGAPVCCGMCLGVWFFDGLPLIGFIMLTVTGSSRLTSNNSILATLTSTATFLEEAETHMIPLPSSRCSGALLLVQALDSVHKRILSAVRTKALLYDCRAL
jgi:hypothetical protein